ncbi:glycosyltransferase family 2 protein [Paenibacillus sp. P22]|uniref:glycosyltransferase family 2 protein n=1 Tax=Paenibacillus sp. P22 TaxID=483908 RepID=UPI0009FB44A6|nr:glycosyltransferase family 2 protein [Paenibacillus sp. P22]
MSEVQVSVVIPVYNEEEVLPETYLRLKSVMEGIGCRYELIFVNDGSRDLSGAMIEDWSRKDSAVRLLDFSRNFGHQIAITAGMDHAAGEAVVIIDADLQDPPELIVPMLEKWREGYDVVYAKRVSRSGETAFKKWSASLFYRVLRASTDISIPVDTGDFRLMDRQVLEQMKRLHESSRFVRGLVSWVGFRQTALEYERDERFAGETKYPLKRMVKLCLDGITSFSTKPLKIAGYAGALLSATGFFYLLVVLWQALFTSGTMKGWASMMAVMLLFNGFVLAMLGVLGEYVGRIYEEAKGRPLYILREARARPVFGEGGGGASGPRRPEAFSHPGAPAVGMSRRSSTGR